MTETFSPTSWAMKSGLPAIQGQEQWQQVQALYLAWSYLPSFATFGKIVNLPLPSFSHLEGGENNNIYIIYYIK